MTIYEQFKEALLDEQRHGRTQVQIAAAHNVSQQYVSKLLLRSNTCEGITLGVVQKMFPNATLNLNGGSNHVITKLWANNGGVNVNNGVNSTSAEAFRQKAIAAMIRLNISGDALKLVLNALMNIEA